MSANNDSSSIRGTSFEPSALLRGALVADAVASLGSALLMIAGAGLLEGLLGLPTALLREAGLLLVPYVVLVGVLALRRRVHAAAVWSVIAGNAAWVAGSAVLLVSGWVAPTALGYAFVAAQALAVAVFADLQYVGLRRRPAAIG
jgi:hypothetical protein